MNDATTPSQRRRQRERAELRSKILNATQEIAQQDGLGAVTIRNVAARIEYSPPTIYEFFESKEDLLGELAGESYSMLMARLQPVAELPVGPGDRVRMVVKFFWSFAFQQPELYGAMLLPSKDASGFQNVVALIARLVAEHRPSLGAEGAENAAIRLLAAVSGLISLANGERAPVGAERAEALLDETVAAFLAS